MISKRLKLVTMALTVLVLSTGTLAGCKKTVGTSSKDISSIETKPATPMNNKDKVFRALGGWPKPPLYNGNNWGGGVGPAFSFVYEGLFNPIRSTDTIYNWLAEDIKHEGNKSIVTLKSGVKWADGEPYTSKDVWAFYILNWGTQITKYLEAIETPDDKTVVFVWQEPAPYPELRKKLIASENQGVIGYHQYKQYVDTMADIFKKAKKQANRDKQGPFGMDLDPYKKEIDDNWNKFTKSGPDFPLGTGPYKVKTVTATDMILEKNDKYRDLDVLTFEQMHFKQVPDQAGQLALLKAGELDWVDGTPARDILENILAANKDLVHYRQADPASVGMMFNIRRKPFDNVKFRQAITYIIDRKQIREVANYYGVENPKVSAAGIVLSRLDKVLLPEVKSKMTDYTTNHSKAEELLKEIGWKKGSDGIWTDENGKKYEFTIASDSGDARKINGGQIVADQLTKFGLPTKLKSVDGSVYWGNADKGEYDISTDWVDINWGFTDDWNTIRDAYTGSPRSKCGLPLLKVEGSFDDRKLDLKVPGPDGNIVDVQKTIDNIPLTADAEQRRKMFNDLIWIYNENCWVVDWFQNTTGAWMNTKTIGGKYPMLPEWAKTNRDLPIPTNDDDMLRAAGLNDGFGGLKRSLTNGDYWPR